MRWQLYSFFSGLARNLNSAICHFIFKVCSTMISVIYCFWFGEELSCKGVPYMIAQVQT